MHLGRKEGSGSDSGRFLAAGARRAFWLRTAVAMLARGDSENREESENTIVESNSICNSAARCTGGGGL